MGLEGLVKVLGEGIPDLEDLPAFALERVAREVVFQRLVRKLDFEVEVSGINIKEEIGLFLSLKTSLTRSTYFNALKELNKYASHIKKRLLEFTFRDADNYIFYLMGKGYSSASVCLKVSVASGLCSFIERRWFGGLDLGLAGGWINPFRGTRVRPKPVPVRGQVIPTEREVGVILERFPDKLVPGVAIMSMLGLRCGALRTLEISEGVYHCVSKGKSLEGKVPDELLRFLSGYFSHRPEWYKTVPVDAFKMSVRRHSKKLYNEGELRAVYSCHDFRHYYAVKEYRKDKDIWRVSRLLGHNAITATESYLKSLGENTG